MKKITLSALTLAFALSAGSAFAAEDVKPVPPKGPHAEHPMFKETDKNGDGVLSKDEWRAKGDTMFAEIDTNKDGKLSPDEMKAHHEKRREEMKEKWKEHKELKGEKPEAPVPPAEPKK